jgi:hypothetical protein
MVSLPESVTKSKQWPMWVGSQADLLRLLRLVEKRYEPLLADHATKLTAQPRKRLSMSEAHKGRLLQIVRTEEPSIDPFLSERLDDVNSDIEEETQKLRQAESTAAGAGRIDMSLTGKDNERRSVTGTASELVDYLDGRYIDEVEFEAPSGDIRSHSISVRASRRNGLYLRVSSTDAQWCIAGFAEISDEVVKQLPVWRFVRNPVILWLFYSALSAVGLWFAGDTIAIWTTETGKFSGSAADIARTLYSGGMIAVVLAGLYLTRRLIPAFEVVRSGNSSVGGRVFTVLGSSIGAVVLGVVGNAVSKVVVG